MAETPAPRMFVGIMAYHWETRDKKFYPYDASCPYEELRAQGYRLYRFSADLPWHDLAPPAGHEMVVAPYEEDDTKEPLAPDQSLKDYVFGSLCRVVARLLPGRVYAPYGSVQTSYRKDEGAIHITTRHGQITLTVKDRS